MGDDMAKPNFKFQKRQKELDRKKKQDEKLLRKQDKGASLDEEGNELPEAEEAEEAEQAEEAEEDAAPAG
jgi:hypothetical protein